MTESSQNNQPPPGQSRLNNSKADVIEASLQTRAIGRPVTWFDSIDSTNHYALHVAGGEELHGRLLVADSQTAGRGRYGREWFSKPGDDLLFSMILYPPEPKALWNLLTLIMAVSICEALRDTFKINAEIRWPNDVTLSGKKVCGILTEVAREIDGRLVVGVGINVNSCLADYPADLQPTMTTLKDEFEKTNNADEISRWTLLNALLIHFEEHYDQFCRRETERLADFCRRWTGTLGRVVEVRLADQTFIASAIDLEENGSLVVRRETGVIEKLHSGDVVEIKPTE